MPPAVNADRKREADIKSLALSSCSSFSPLAKSLAQTIKNVISDIRHLNISAAGNGLLSGLFPVVIFSGNKSDNSSPSAETIS